MSKSLLLKRIAAFTIAVLFILNPLSQYNKAFAEDEYAAMSEFITTENKNDQIVDVLDNITESYTCTGDPWRILDTIVYLGREESKANLSIYLGSVNEMLADPAPSLFPLGTAGLVLSALGYDIAAYPLGDSTINLINLIEESGEFYTPDGSINLYSASNALYALNSGDYEIAEGIVEQVVEDIALAQYADGGWGFDGVNGDVDTTAMCVAALAPYREDSNISAVLQRAVDFLSAAQGDSGGYSSFGSENSNTAAMVLIALVTLGIDPDSDTRFIKNDNTIIDAIMYYCTESSNGFGYTNKVYNSFATEQVYRALISYIKFTENGKPETGFSPYSFVGYTGMAQDAAEYDANLTSLAAADCELEPFFDMALTNYECTTDKSSIDIIFTQQNEDAHVSINQGTDLNVPLLYGDNTVTIEAHSGNGQWIKTYIVDVFRTGGSTGGGIPEQKINVSIIGRNSSTILPRTAVKYKAGDTPFSVLKRVASENEIEVTSSGSGSAVYVSGINGLFELDYGAGSGWMYSINGVFHQKSAAVLKLKAGDELKWEYTTELGDDIGGGISYTKKKTEEPEETQTKSYSATEITKLIGEIKDSIPLNSETSNWGMFVHARLSQEFSYELAELMKLRLNEYSGGFRKITDAAGLILTLSAVGFDVCNIEGENLVERLLNSDRMLNQGLNGPIFSLIAIDSVVNTAKDTVWSRESLLNTIIDAQNPDGGFSLSESEGSNIDITAMAVYALSEHKGDVKADRAIENAVKYISEKQLESGGFMLYNQENCESAAQVIIALTALGIDPTRDDRFIKDDTSLIDALLSYRLKNGGFSHISGEDANDMATEQALLALMAYSNYLNDLGGVYALQAPDVPVFSDVMEISSWAFDAVMEAAEVKLMVGSGGFFKPRDSLTRAELAQLLTRLFELDTDTADTEFADVAQGAWYEGAVAAVSQAGLMLGASESKFNPNSILTREELAVVIYRALKLTSGDISSLNDADDISSWARDAVGAVAAAGIIMGSGSAFNPRDDVTRETAATVFMRLKSQI